MSPWDKDLDQMPSVLAADIDQDATRQGGWRRRAGYDASAVGSLWDEPGQVKIRLTRELVGLITTCAEAEGLRRTAWCRKIIAEAVAQRTGKDPIQLLGKYNREPEHFNARQPYAP